MIKLKDIVESMFKDPKDFPWNDATRKQFVLMLSREIIKAFNKGETRLDHFFKLSGQMVTDEERADVHLIVKFKRKPKQDYAFSISAGADGSRDIVDMVIEYKPSEFPKAMNALVAEVKETLEHEFEHVQQGTFYKQWIQSNRYDEPLVYPSGKHPQAPSHFLYLTSNVEVPAYVKGLLKRAKVKRISFEEALEDYYKDYKDTFDEEGTDWNAVKSVWMDWYNKNKDVPGMQLKRPVR
jgi:hypothetical protein